MRCRQKRGGETRRKYDENGGREREEMEEKKKI